MPELSLYKYDISFIYTYLTFLLNVKRIKQKSGWGRSKECFRKEWIIRNSFACHHSFFQKKLVKCWKTCCKKVFNNKPNFYGCTRGRMWEACLLTWLDFCHRTQVIFIFEENMVACHSIQSKLFFFFLTKDFFPEPTTWKVLSSKPSSSHIFFKNQERCESYYLSSGIIQSVTFEPPFFYPHKMKTWYCRHYWFLNKPKSEQELMFF